MYVLLTLWRVHWVASTGEWLHFVKHMGLIDSRQLTLPQAKSIFLWSRVRCISSVGTDQEIRLRHLFFEDFLEALVRMATMMAFPTQVATLRILTPPSHHSLASMHYRCILAFPTQILPPLPLPILTPWCLSAPPTLGAFSLPSSPPLLTTPWPRR